MVLRPSRLAHSHTLGCLMCGCCLPVAPGYPTCSGADAALFRALRGQHLHAWAPLVQRPGNGAWAPACIAHTMSAYEWTDPTWE
eukprot:5352155-Prymnesium_polylepis.1